MRLVILSAPLIFLGAVCLATAGCDSSDEVTATPQLAREVQSFDEFPVFWLGDEYDVDGDGNRERLVSARFRVNPERRDSTTGEALRPAWRSYTISYGPCDPGPGEDTCALPLTMTFQEPCSWYALHPIPVTPQRTVRGVEAIVRANGAVRIKTEGALIIINASGKDEAAMAANALRIAEDLEGANSKSEFLAPGSDFPVQPGDKCSAGVVTPPLPEPDPNALILVDAFPSLSGTQSLHEVGTGEDFTIALDASAATGAEGYVWQLQWNDDVLDFVSASENTSETGATLCSPASRNATAPAGKEWQGGGAGCLRSSGTLPATVRLVMITLKCNVTDGSTTELHLVTTDEDPLFGTTFIAPGGAQAQTALIDAEITCGAP